MVLRTASRVRIGADRSSNPVPGYRTILPIMTPEEQDLYDRLHDFFNEEAKKIIYNHPDPEVALDAKDKLAMQDWLNCLRVANAIHSLPYLSHYTNVKPNQI
jgi:hypothetical protein